VDIQLTYSELKSIVAAKSLYFQHYENTKQYLIWSLDDMIVYKTIIWKDGCCPIDQDPATMSANIVDFESNYKSISNQSLNQKQQPLVQTIKPSYGNRAWTFSHNYCDKTTWSSDSVRVVNEVVGTGDGSTTVFNLDNTFVIDVTHGKTTDEDYLVPSVTQGGTTFVPEIKVNNVVKTERKFTKNSGGDYEIDYASGSITFYTAPGNGLPITASYFYSPPNSGSTVYITPDPGTKTIITAIECQMSADVDMRDSMISAVFTYNPYLGAPPAKFEYPGTRATYKRMWDFIGYTNGSYPVIPPLGGSTRGFTQNVHQLRYEYVVAITLDSAYGTELRVWLEEHIPYGGEISEITFYGYQENS
jgi:hypothetical protein